MYVYNVRGIMLMLYLCVHVFMCVCCMLQRLQTRLVRFGPIIGDLNLCSLWTRYISNSKTDPLEDLEVRTGSCSEDQTAILIQNHAISCECLFLCYFLIYCSLWAFICYSYYFMWSSDIFYQCD